MMVQMKGEDLYQTEPNLHGIPQILDLVSAASRILLVTHVMPDGDAIGSLLGLGHLLEEQGHDVTMICVDPVPDVYSWLPGSQRIVRSGLLHHDLVISLDCSDARRMGEVDLSEMQAVPLANIDHHVTNTFFGAVNWVDPSSVATAQMVLNLADFADWEVSAMVATCLLTGLITDTRSFRTPNVDDVALRSALRLTEQGAAINEITQRVLEQRPLASIRLWGQAIERLELKDGVLWTEVTQEMRARWRLPEDGESGLTNFLSGVREASVVVVFSEKNNGTVDVSMRAVPEYDVARIALRLGGGGHPQAAGCTLEGDLEQVRSLVLFEVRNSLDAQGASSAQKLSKLSD
jgi:phosphoesterase RecJ-like protein